jgi:Ca2+-binding EF-hand superfamily protein
MAGKSWVALRSLCRIFAAMDDGSGQLEEDDFRWGLIDLGLQLSKEECSELCSKFGGGKINYADFLNELRGSCNAERMEVIKACFAKINVNGTVKLDDIAQAFDVANHIDLDKRTERDVFMEFMSLWANQDKDALVSEKEFCDYMEDVSGLIDSNTEFKAVMTNAWHCE